jgi:hypothetical protein
MSTHLDGPVHALSALRPPTTPPPSLRAVATCGALTAVAALALSVPVVRAFGPSGPFAAFGLLFHGLVTLPLLMAALLFAVALAAAAVVALVGLAARIVRPSSPTGARALCFELLEKGAIVLPGYLAAWRRMRLAWVRGLVLGLFAAGALLFVAVRGGLVVEV